MKKMINLHDIKLVTFVNNIAVPTDIKQDLLFLLQYEFKE